MQLHEAHVLTTTISYQNYCMQLNMSQATAEAALAGEQDHHSFVHVFCDVPTGTHLYEVQHSIIKIYVI